eukprot:3755328-Rhodomonas_salina.2
MNPPLAEPNYSAALCTRTGGQTDSVTTLTPMPSPCSSSRAAPTHATTLCSPLWRGRRSSNSKLTGQPHARTQHQHGTLTCPPAAGTTATTGGWEPEQALHH